jgi:hypothetical protein
MGRLRQVRDGVWVDPGQMKRVMGSWFVVVDEGKVVLC